MAVTIIVGIIIAFQFVVNLYRDGRREFQKGFRRAFQTV